MVDKQQQIIQSAREESTWRNVVFEIFFILELNAKTTSLEKRKEIHILLVAFLKVSLKI